MNSVLKLRVGILAAAQRRVGGEFRPGTSKAGKALSSVLLDTMARVDACPTAVSVCDLAGSNDPLRGLVVPGFEPSEICWFSGGFLLSLMAYAGGQGVRFLAFHGAELVPAKSRRLLDLERNRAWFGSRSVPITRVGHKPAEQPDLVLQEKSGSFRLNVPPKSDGGPVHSFGVLALGREEGCRSRIVTSGKVDCSDSVHESGFVRLLIQRLDLLLPRNWLSDSRVRIVSHSESIQEAFCDELETNSFGNEISAKELFPDSFRGWAPTITKIKSLASPLREIVLDFSFFPNVEWISFEDEL